MSKAQIEILERALLRERAARKQAEKILEKKSIELYGVTQQLKESNRQLEGLLSEKTSELKGVFENIVDAYVMMDLWGNVLKMNDAAIELLGYDVAKEPFNLMELVHKDDMAYTTEAFRGLYENGSFTDYQARIVTKSKDIKLVHVNSRVIYNKEGKPTAAQGIVRDITQETIDKEIFEEQKRQLEIIVEDSPIGIVLTVDGNIVKSNKAFQELMGYTEEELLDKHVKELTYQEDQKSSIKKMEKMNKSTEEQFSMIKRYRRKDATIITAKTIVNAVRDHKGNIKYQVALVDDITEQVAIEKQKEKLLANLEKSNEELKEYAHIVSHDLKSPLRSISTLASWLREDYKDILDKDGQNNLLLMQEKVEKMDHLIDGILKYSSINKDAITKEEVNVHQVVEEIINTIYIPEHISIFITDELPIIKADRIRIKQLFQNVISNAVEHINKKKGTIKVGCKNEQKSWIFTIKDNGKGIPKVYHKKIFHVFQSLSNDNKSTGIGLSIVKKIVDLYEGEIWLESEDDIGTTFFIRLKK
ncbi:PAS domain S-box protein [Leptobacterium sp. I13]|uniref:sensor histidine kinase n=1 Tax=Leptobacterium meishanense TaxID=3128904 RepID=UPI0030EDEBBE